MKTALTPEEIRILQNSALQITEPIIDFLFADIARRIKKAGEITSTAEYQIYRANALGQSNKAIKEFLSSQLEIADEQLNDMFDYLVDNTVAFEKNRTLQNMVRGYLNATKKDLESLLNGKNIGLIAPDGHLYPLQKAYEKYMDFAFRQALTGAVDVNTAVQTAASNMFKAGVKAIPQKNGRTIGIEYATRRYVMNNLGLAYAEIGRLNHDELGLDGWEISAHAGCAPDHIDIQGRQFSDKQYEKINGELTRPIGTLNCGHIAFPILLGTPPAHSKEELERFKMDNEVGVTVNGTHYTIYQATQYQRGLENAIRKQKHRCTLASEDKERLMAEQIRLGRIKTEYTMFSRNAGLPQTPEHLWAAGFGRSSAGKARATYSKARQGFISRSANIFENNLSDVQHKYLGRVDIKNEKLVDELKKSFVDKYKLSEVENMLVITQNGEVHFVTNNSAYGVDCSILGDKLRGSYNIHNHPPNATQFSFSIETDIPAMFTDGTKIMEAFDHKYLYRFERPNISLEEWERVRVEVRDVAMDIMQSKGYNLNDYEEQYLHTWISEICERLNIKESYTRKDL